jgi:hypothetical protein
MTTPEIDPTKWPLIYQIFGGLGVAIASALAFMGGKRSKPDNTEAELARLRDERQHERDERQHERDSQISEEIEKIRADFALVIEALKKSSNDRFLELKGTINDIDVRLRLIERKVDVFDDRFKNQRH